MAQLHVALLICNSLQLAIWHNYSIAVIIVIVQTSNNAIGQAASITVVQEITYSTGIVNAIVLSLIHQLTLRFNHKVAPSKN